MLNFIINYLSKTNRFDFEMVDCLKIICFIRVEGVILKIGFFFSGGKMEARYNYLVVQLILRIYLVNELLKLIFILGIAFFD